MIAISFARILRIPAPSSGTRSRPCHSTWPATMRPGGIGTSFITVSAVTVFPQPDSPTTPSVSPRSTVRSTPSTACTQPSSVAKWVFKPRMSSSTLLHHLARIERVAQPVADEVDREHGEEDRPAGNQRPVGRDVQVVLGVVQDPPPGRDVGR